MGENINKRFFQRVFGGVRPVLEAAEERLPLGIDRAGIGGVSGLEAFDIGGVAAVQKRRVCERSVRVLA